MLLNDLKIGQLAKIKELPVNSASYMTLLSLGILPGDQLEVTGKAIFGGPITFKHSNNTFFALRRKQAKQIQVQPLRH